jgi:hypothetical protein
MNSSLTIRLATLLAALALPLASPVQAAPSSKAEVKIRATVLSYFRVGAVSQPADLHLTDNDVARGYVDLPEASSFQVASNTRTHMTVAVAFDPAIVTKVGARLLDSEVVASVPGGAAAVTNDHVGKRHVTVTYRVYLNKDVRPGQYAWPIGLRISA